MADDDEIPDPLAAFDQALRAIADMARAVHTHYAAMVAAGFNSEQALQLTVAFEQHLLAQGD